MSANKNPTSKNLRKFVQIKRDSLTRGKSYIVAMIFSDLPVFNISQPQLFNAEMVENALIVT